jgi:hypothetical protein
MGGTREDGMHHTQQLEFRAQRAIDSWLFQARERDERRGEVRSKKALLAAAKDHFSRELSVAHDRAAVCQEALKQL